MVKERSKWHEVYNKNKPTIVLGDESSEDEGKNEKNEAKQQPGMGRKNEPSQKGKDEQKQEVSELSLREKVEYTA